MKNENAPDRTLPAGCLCAKCANAAYIEFEREEKTIHCQVLMNEVYPGPNGKVTRCDLFADLKAGQEQAQEDFSEELDGSPD